MRLHKSEAAFVVFMAIILTTGILILNAYSILDVGSAKLFRSEHASEANYLERLLFAGGVLTTSALFVGAFLIYPLIRTLEVVHFA